MIHHTSRRIRVQTQNRGFTRENTKTQKSSLWGRFEPRGGILKQGSIAEEYHNRKTVSHDEIDWD